MAEPQEQGAREAAAPVTVIVPLTRPVVGAVSLQVSFDRRELSQILNIYGRMVSAGEWRDYAMDFLRDRAVFSIFRRTSETPLFTVVKNPALARKQGMYAVISGAEGVRQGAAQARVSGSWHECRVQIKTPAFSHRGFVVVSGSRRIIRAGRTSSSASGTC
jgi:hypothetical protein